MTTNPKVNKKILALFEGDEVMSQAEFLKAFEQAVSHILKMEKDLIERDNKKISELEASYSQALYELKNKSTGELNMTREDAKKMMSSLMETHKKHMNEIEARVATIRDGQDADEGRVVGEVLKRIVFPEPVLDTPSQVRDKLEGLEDGEKLSIQAIQDLTRKLEELDKKIAMGGSRSSASLISKRIRFIDDETPSGTINGTNTVFTLSKAPETGSLKVYRGGARQRVTEDYTFSGKTITFTIAPVSGEIILVDYRY